MHLSHWPKKKFMMFSVNLLTFMKKITTVSYLKRVIAENFRTRKELHRSLNQVLGDSNNNVEKYILTTISAHTRTSSSI
jgi:hypothetical protein